MIRNLLFTLIASLIFISCSKTIDNTGTCSDGKQNQGEQGIDCGGPCPAICPSCADGIMNQNETAVDCGGDCDPCYPRLSAKVDTIQWNSTSRNAFISGPGILRIFGTDQFKSFTLYYSGPFASGTTETGVLFTGELRDENGTLYSSTTGGSITFTTFDTVNKKVSGIFQVEVQEAVNGTTFKVTNGVFTDLSY